MRCQPGLCAHQSCLTEIPKHECSCFMWLCSVDQSCPTLCDPSTVGHQAPLSMGFSRNIRVGYHFLLQGIFSTQGSSPGREQDFQKCLTNGKNLTTVSYYYTILGFHWWLSSTESACQCRRCRFDPSVWRRRKIPWRRKWQPDAVFLPGKSHGQRSLAGSSSWSHKSQTQFKD